MVGDAATARRSCRQWPAADMDTKAQLLAMMIGEAILHPLRFAIQFSQLREAYVIPT